MQKGEFARFAMYSWLRFVKTLSNCLAFLDFHAGLLLASTIPWQIFFFVRLATPTPSAEQLYGDGVTTRGPSHSIHTIRVDGIDLPADLSAIMRRKRRSG